MNAQDKAKELVERYLSAGMIITQAKQCAIIEVDEVLKAAFYANDELYNFYLETKKEIELL
jgi:hypothetical protein